MIFDDNFIEYIGLDKSYDKLNNSSFKKSFIEGILNFNGFLNADIIRVYINISNDEINFLKKEDLYFCLLKIDLNVEYIDNDKFGMIEIKNFTYYKSIFYEHNYSSFNLHNFSNNIKITRKDNQNYYLYLSIKSVVL